MIRDSYVASSSVYGARRVFGDLREAGETCGKHLAAKIMGENKIKAVRGYKAPRYCMCCTPLFPTCPSRNRSSAHFAPWIGINGRLRRRS